MCVDHGGDPVSLEVRKVYATLPDHEALRLRMLRVIDESGEDYLYPRRFFVDVRLPPAASKAFKARAL